MLKEIIEKVEKTKKPTEEDTDGGYGDLGVISTAPYSRNGFGPTDKEKQKKALIIDGNIYED